MDDLASEYHRSISWIQKQIYEYEPVLKIHNPRTVNLVCNATFYGKRKDKLGTLVFKDSMTKEVLIWKHIQKVRQSKSTPEHNEKVPLGCKYLLTELYDLMVNSDSRIYH